jgi:ABC-type transporter Mla subunit MlaD
MDEVKKYITSELGRFFVFLEKPDGNIDQQLGATEAAVKAMVDSAETDIKNYVAAATTSVKDYVRQIDNEADILAAVATLAMDVKDLAAEVRDALPKA